MAGLDPHGLLYAGFLCLSPQPWDRAQGTEPGWAPGGLDSTSSFSITCCVTQAKTPLPFPFCRQGVRLEGLQGPEHSDLCDFWVSTGFSLSAEGIPG